MLIIEMKRQMKRNLAEAYQVRKPDQKVGEKTGPSQNLEDRLQPSFVC
jgi:hypothetical protein